MDSLLCSIGDTVKIKKTGVLGTIDAVFKSRNCDWQYRVEYADKNNLVCSTYFFSEDLEKE